MLRIKPHETEIRTAVVGSFLDLRGYQYELIEREYGGVFFRLQQRSDLEDLQEYLGGHSAHLVRELAFTTGVFADEFDFDVLDPEEIYRFLLARDKLRYGWRPRGRYHIPPSDISERFEIDDSTVAVPPLPSGTIRTDYTIEWIAGMFDGLCRYRPSISESSEHVVGYGMHPIARLYRGGVHSSLVTHVQQFCEDYDLNYGDTSDSNTLNISFTGPSHIRRVLDILFPRLLVLAEHSELVLGGILPRFDDEEHHTKPGFYRLFRDFDPVARASGGPFKNREYTPEYFAQRWKDDLGLTAGDTTTEPSAAELDDSSRDESDQEWLSELETLTLSPEEYRGEVGRYQTLVDRIYRDQTMVEDLKQLYGDRCQLCGTRLARRDGTGYSEVHHLQPLGRPHDGPDVRDNVLVLCPNHHSDFDNGVVEVDPGTLEIVHPYGSAVDGNQIIVEGDHQPGVEFLTYHNERIAGRSQIE